jgi:hypothetical protein
VYQLIAIVGILIIMEAMAMAMGMKRASVARVVTAVKKPAKKTVIMVPQTPLKSSETGIL